MHKDKKINRELAWAKCQFSLLEMTLDVAEPEVVISTPWSTVWRFHTNEGVVYLKQTPPEIGLEAQITQILQNQFNASVPDVLAVNEELHCFLMKDAGQPLRTVLKENFNAELIRQAIQAFRTLQDRVAEKPDVFLEMGVPDWRLEKLPGLFEALLAEKEILLMDGLTEPAYEELQATLPAIKERCQQLAELKIKPSLVQCDFHDNNILIDPDTQKLTFIDLGEVVISYPYFSMMGCLWQLKKHHGVNETHLDYAAIEQACLANDSHECLTLAQPLWFVLDALAQYRLREACNTAAFLAYQQRGKLANTCRGIIGAFE